MNFKTSIYKRYTEASYILTLQRYQNSFRGLEKSLLAMSLSKHLHVFVNNPNVEIWTKSENRYSMFSSILNKVNQSKNFIGKLKINT